MRKILFLLLLTVAGYGQTTTGKETKFPYGIRNQSVQTITTPTYLNTQGTDGTQGVIPSAYIEKTANKQNSLAIDGTGTKYPTVDAVNNGVLYKRTISQIRALSGSLSNNFFYTTDINQEGEWYYDSTDSTSSDNTGTILVTSDGKRIKRIFNGLLNVKWFNQAGVNDNVIFENALSVGDVFIPNGNYTFLAPVTIPPSRRIIGESYGNMSSPKSIITHSGGEAFVTNSSIIDFSGVTLKNLRIKGGTATKYAISSHYPYTYLENIHIESDSGSGKYLGNGIRIHNDGGSSSMGGWNSTITNCKVVCDENDIINYRTLLKLEINGGNVSVVKNDFLLGNTGINIVSGESFLIEGNNLNKIRDRISTNGNIINGAIVIGGLSGSVAKNVSINSNYIEANSRAVVINEAYNTSILNNYINDVGFADPGFALDGNIYISSLSKKVSIDNNYMEIRYNLQSMIFANSDYISSSNFYFHDRVSNPYFGNGQFQGTKAKSNTNDSLRTIYSSIDSTVNITNTDGGSYSGVIASTVPTGTSPLSVTSTTVISNLNADLLDGFHSSSFFRGTLNNNKIPKYLGSQIFGDSSITDDGISVSSTIPISSNVSITSGSNTQTSSSVNVNGASGSIRALSMLSAGLRRWAFRTDNTVESGSNLGSDFRLTSYSDLGSFLSDILFIKRSSGNICIKTILDNNVDALQVNGTVSFLAGTTSGQGVNKGQLDLKSNISSPTFTGVPLAPTAVSGTNTTQIATTAFAQGIRPYKVYTAILTQVGTDAPTAIVLENTIGSIVWSRTIVGGYFATLSGAFTTDKTSVLITNGSANATYIHGASVSTSNVNVITASDGQIDRATIEIRVYN